MLADYVRNSGFADIHVEELVRELVGILATYREEGSPLFPEVFVFDSAAGLTALAPSTGVISVNRVVLNGDSAKTIVKDCATIANRGWAIFAVKDGEAVRYGLFRSLRHSLATSAEESMCGLGQGVPVIMIRNRGQLVVELRNTNGERFTAALTTTPAQPSPLEGHVEKFVTAVIAKVEDSEQLKSYLVRVLTDALQNCHGTLMAVIDVPEAAVRPESLTDGTWPDPPINLSELFRAAKGNDAVAHADLVAAETLMRGMINSDGVVVFGSNGTILSYRVFLKPQQQEHAGLPEAGGGRRRTFELMKLRVPAVFKAVFFRSQDGVTGCERNE